MAIRQSRGITLGKGTPQRLEGQNGDITIRSSRKGLKLYVKESNKWHSVDLDIDLRQIASTVRRLEDAVKRLSTKTNNTPVVDKLLLRQSGGTSAVGIQNKSGLIAFRNSTDTSDIKLETKYLDVSADVKTLLDNANTADFKTDLSLVKGDVGLGNVDNESKATMFTNPSFTTSSGSLNITAGSATDTVVVTGASMTASQTGGSQLMHVEQTFNAPLVTSQNDHSLLKVNVNTTGSGISDFSNVYTYSSSEDDTINFGVKHDGSIDKGSITSGFGTINTGSSAITTSGTISAGNVGIGTTSPTTTLDVEGTVSYKHTAFSTAGPTDGIDVSDTTVLEVDTSSNNVTIGGFSGGVQGQILYIVKTDTANFIQLEHNETPAAGSHQKIFLTSGSDERVVGYGGYTLYCNGSAWFSLSNPTGAADAG
jgi:hypothetical protein